MAQIGSTTMFEHPSNFCFNNDVMKTFHYRWDWGLQASREALWPLVADTNRFDRDTGLPTVERVQSESDFNPTRQHLRYLLHGIPLEFEQEPFEWTYPSHFSVTRHFKSGPIGQLRVLVELKPRPDGGTNLTYQVWATPRNLLSLIAIPIQIGWITARRFDRAFRHYDRLASQKHDIAHTHRKPQLTPGGLQRLQTYRTRLIELGFPTKIVQRFVDLIAYGDDLVLSRLRPYELADYWQADRRAVLQMFLYATRLGLLNFRWDLLCPLCRGAKAIHTSLADLPSEVHCATCNIDYRANFERSVELTFRPNEAIRVVVPREYCIGGPQATPHVVIQKQLSPGDQAIFNPNFEPGRYRLRALGLPGGLYLQAVPDGIPELTLRPTPNGWQDYEPHINLSPTLILHNPPDQERLFILEGMAWSDNSATAAEVIAMQTFRDLFASEALRPGERISVGCLTVVFTDLRESTRMYRRIGDARAFGLVMQHFDILKTEINAQNGAVIKTLGDAVMAVFLTPVEALRALMNAQVGLQNAFSDAIPLTLKVGIHHGPCIAVTLNDRLDYFGSTVNLSSRLTGFSSGNDIVISDAVYKDSQVQELLRSRGERLKIGSLTVPIKGFEEPIRCWRVVVAGVGSEPAPATEPYL